jgi:hypothetical protein
MVRIRFWLWVAVLFVSAEFALIVESFLLRSGNVAWPTLQELIGGIRGLETLVQNMGMSWPRHLALTQFPLGIFATNISFMYFTMPVLVVINLLALAPMARRSRDAGYSPFWTIVLANWATLGTLAILGTAGLIGMLSESVAMTIFFPIYMYFGSFNQIAATIAMAFAIYRLSAPSEPGPNPLEVTP